MHSSLRMHCESFQITWTVVNFNFSDTLCYSLRSPSFTLSSRVPSSWYLGLEWTCKDANEKVLTLYLIKKLDSAQLEKGHRVSVRFGFINRVGSKHWHPDVYNGFLCGRGVIGMCTDICYNYCNTTLTFLCDVIVYNDRDPEPKDTMFSLVSCPVLYQMPLYKYATAHLQKHELKIVTKDGELLTNKELFRSRCTKFDALVTDSEKKCINLESVTTIVMEQILLYIYCNLLDYHTDNFVTFDLYDIALKLGVDSLIALLEPRKLQLKTEAGGGKYNFIWYIEKFPFFEWNNRRESRILASNFCQDLTWRLVMYVNVDKISINLEILKGNPVFDANIRISICSKAADYTRTYSIPFIQDKIVGEENFLVLDEDFEYDDFLQEDYLVIDCWVSHSDMKFKNTVDLISETENSYFVDNSETVIDKLKEKEPKLIISIPNRNFLVHEDIVSRRSESILKSLLSQRTQQQVLHLSISDDILELILRYIYTGKLFVQDYETALEIYKESFALNVDILREICASYLKYKIVREKAWKLLCLADDFGDESVKNFALNYICRNASSVMNSDDYRFMDYKHRHLKKQITRALTITR